MRRAFLGPVEAANASYIARSIENVPITIALAIRERQKLQDGCRGWQFWANADLLDTDKDGRHGAGEHGERSGFRYARA